MPAAERYGGARPGNGGVPWSGREQPGPLSPYGWPLGNEPAPKRLCAPIELEARTVACSGTLREGRSRLACAVGKVRHGWASAGAAPPGTGRITLATIEPRLAQPTRLRRLVHRKASQGAARVLLRRAG